VNVAEPPTDARPPDYAPPSDDATPPDEAIPPGDSGPGPRNVRRIVAAILIVLVVAVIGYAVAGFSFATSRIDRARTTYNAVVAHQNAITDTVNLFNTKFTTTTANAAATASDLKADRSLLDQVVSESRGAEATSAADDASLASAQASLKDNAWLTVFNRSSLENYSRKIGHERKALGDSKILAGDYVLLAMFYQSFFDALIDFDVVGNKIQASDFAGAVTDVAALKADLARALQATNAPGLPPEVRLFIIDFQTFATDETSLLVAVNSSDVSAGQALSPKVTADVTKLDSYDFTKIGTEIASYYTPLIDDYNSEISKANSL
jgi:hypothetical protein